MIKIDEKTPVIAGEYLVRFETGPSMYDLISNVVEVAAPVWDEMLERDQLYFHMVYWEYDPSGNRMECVSEAKKRFESKSYFHVILSREELYALLWKQYRWENMIESSYAFVDFFTVTECDELDKSIKEAKVRELERYLK